MIFTHLAEFDLKIKLLAPENILNWLTGRNFVAQTGRGEITQGMNARILVAEDDIAIAKAVRDALTDSGFAVNVVRDGTKVLPALTSYNFTLLLLDLMLPGMHGVEVCREIRKSKISIPILMLTAKDSLMDRVSGLDAGADDYLTKPFEKLELMARVRALLRRHHAVKSSEIHVADLYLNTNSKIVRRGGREVLLTPREFSLLEALAQNAGSVLSKETISERVWLDSYTSPNTVEVHVKNLRRKIDGHGEERLIQTVHGMGYTLRVG